MLLQLVPGTKTAEKSSILRWSRDTLQGPSVFRVQLYFTIYFSDQTNTILELNKFELNSGRPVFFTTAFPGIQKK